MKFVNLLDKVVVVNIDYLKEHVVKPHALRNEIEKISTFKETENGFSFYKHQVRGLPDPEEGTIYITEKHIVALFPERTDLVFCARTQVPFFPGEAEFIHCLGFGRF